MWRKQNRGATRQELPEKQKSAGDGYGSVAHVAKHDFLRADRRRRFVQIPHLCALRLLLHPSGTRIGRLCLLERDLLQQRTQQGDDLQVALHLRRQVHGLCPTRHHARQTNTLIRHRKGRI